MKGIHSIKLMLERLEEFALAEAERAQREQATRETAGPRQSHPVSNERTEPDHRRACAGLGTTSIYRSWWVKSPPTSSSPATRKLGSLSYPEAPNVTSVSTWTEDPSRPWGKGEPR